MQTVTAPVCPKCGRPDPEKLSEQTEPSRGFFAPPDYASRQRIAVFRCQCGVAFTDITMAEESRSEFADSTDDVKIHEVAAEASRLQMKIGRFVDDPNWQIVGFEGEDYMAEIWELAKQCEAVGLDAAADRLHQLGRDVMRRWAE